MLRTTTLLAATLVGAMAVAGSADARSVTISIENNQAAKGLVLTPLVTALHDGTFDTFDPGSAAGSVLGGNEVEALAEDGNPAPLQAAANAAGVTNGVITAPGGFPNAPLIEPGETSSITLHASSTDRYLSFMSMILPSNDFFIGNGNPLAYDIFNLSGPIVITLADVWDAGTEVDFLDGSGEGAPFAVGQTNDSVDENGVVTLAGMDGLANLLGTVTPTHTIDFRNDPTTVLATISVDVAPVPLPAGAPLLLAGLGAFAWVSRKRRTKS